MQLVFPRTFSPGDHLRASDLNLMMDKILEVVNGGIGNDNISSDPLLRIPESKVQFDKDGGHFHDGVSSKNVIQAPVIMGLADVVWTGLKTPPLVFVKARDVTKVRVMANNASTAATVVSLEKSTNNGSSWTSVNSITLPANASNLESNFAQSFSIGDQLRISIGNLNNGSPSGVSLELY